MEMKKLKMVGIAAGILASTLCAMQAFAADHVVLGTNWKAQAGHGGFYQAVADGTYAKYGLDVEILQGGPQVNNRPLLPAGKLDFLMAGNLLQSFDNVKNKIPTIVVAAFYQKDPQVLMAHPEQGYKKFADLTKAKTILLDKSSQLSYWPWMRSQYGFRDEQVRPSNYSLAQFLADKSIVQSGYANAEPIYAEQAGTKPQVFMLSDAGWSTYGSTIETRLDLVRNKPDLVRRFVEASIIGWNHFLYGDHKAAYELIEKANPEMTGEKLDREMKKTMELGLIDSGEAITKGIGALDMARIKDFYEKMIKSGLYKQDDVDLNLVATDKFVNKGIGISLRKDHEQ
jgi:NitT/TauT family transport system substrate-binding protein